MGLIRADKWNSQPYEWLIPGLIGNEITLISGEPKTGKSLLAGHLVSALITQSEILGRSPKIGTFKVAWMGFDSNWAEEVKSRFPNIQRSLYLNPPLTYDKKSEWEFLYLELKSEGINLIVIDHLYGISDTLDLDRQHFMETALKPIYFINNELKIPVVLLSHANKAGGGRAAHSILLEAKVRHFIRITGNLRGSKRDLFIAGNHEACTTLKISLTPESCELLTDSQSSKSETRKSERNGKMIDISKKIISEAPPEAKLSPTAAGEWLFQNSIFKTAEAGRTYIYKLIEGGLLARADTGMMELIPGPALIL